MSKIIGIIVFVILVIIFIYPSYNRATIEERGGEDCLAGCTVLSSTDYFIKGFPFKYYKYHASEWVISGGVAKQYPITEINYLNLVINTIIFAISSFLFTIVINKIIRNFKRT